MGVPAELVVADDQHEIVRDADLALNFQTGAGRATYF